MRIDPAGLFETSAIVGEIPESDGDVVQVRGRVETRCQHVPGAQLGGQIEEAGLARPFLQREQTQTELRQLEQIRPCLHNGQDVGQQARREVGILPDVSQCGTDRGLDIRTRDELQKTAGHFVCHDVRGTGFDERLFVQRVDEPEDCSEL
ncbi:MAG TPA: hypothetical protein VN605_02240, partial [Thermoanaerobaculia bacterium]|nr:hypothetical protein [Thermoanaerobaculia bacterium]